MNTAYPVNCGVGVRIREQVSDNVFGDELPAYRDGRGEIWIGATAGQEYGIEFIVPETGRWMFITSVDGLNIYTGNRSTGNANDGGYVVTAPSKPDANVVPGWSGDGTAAKFVFTQDALSYSSRIGDGRNDGVIGAKVYAEKVVKRPVFLGAIKRFSDNTRGGDTRGLGTGYGHDVEFRVSETEFVPASQSPIASFVYRYAEIPWLVKQGFTRIFRPVSFVHSPNPWPASQGCQPPPGGWRS